MCREPIVKIMEICERLEAIEKHLEVIKNKYANKYADQALKEAQDDKQ